MGICACESMVVLNTCHRGALLTRTLFSGLCVWFPGHQTPTFSLTSHPTPSPLFHSSWLVLPHLLSPKQWVARTQPFDLFSIYLLYLRSHHPLAINSMSTLYIYILPPAILPSFSMSPLWSGRSISKLMCPCAQSPDYPSNMLLPKTFPISANGSSVFPVAQQISLENSLILVLFYSCIPHLMHQQILSALPSKYI